MIAAHGAQKLFGWFGGFGLFTPFAAAAIVGVMIVAIATVHWDKGFFNSAGGYEFNLTLIAASIALAMTGAARTRSITRSILASPGSRGVWRLSLSAALVPP